MFHTKCDRPRLCQAGWDARAVPVRAMRSERATTERQEEEGRRERRVRACARCVVLLLWGWGKGGGGDACMDVCKHCMCAVVHGVNEGRRMVHTRICDAAFLFCIHRVTILGLQN